MDLPFLPPDLVALAGVLLIDIVLAGDNAVVVGMAAAGLAPAQRGKAILWGIVAATAMRIAFALITTQLLEIIGLTLAGGILLLWVCWRMFRELQPANGGVPAHAQVDADGPVDATKDAEGPPRKTLRQAIVQILVADVSMSLDNVLAVAGIAKDHLWVLVVGLTISVALMGVAATFIARLLGRYPWIAWVGLALILYVALDMVWDGWHEVAETL